MSSYNLAQLARLEPNYLARYGLKTAPFSTTHDDRFLYLDAERQQRLHMLQHLTQYSHLLLIVTGEHGVGLEKLRQMPAQFSTEELLQLEEIKAAFDPQLNLNPGKGIPILKRCQEYRALPPRHRHG